ncbi:cytochrome c biogenesis protein ResB [Psychrobacillus lasiicapitis]|uniref:Cytochrome C biogenesis protein n=1 Tax=Psychrobacillus lasiicapitis TaxID=1636719 RepID=A0A544THW9_9BACI|nr:cytochrome c biogenesis protein ResB [Psychrobacillus lasiicapitis]TQR17000.1 cytochrome C biogenesis protein [Psychrobacillus lasiicapitis]GGA25384.1 cytochrome c biogenesis protein [Psychrobacillus lasiicapitis]
MDKIVCTCGNVNPAGTLLCESCGRPLNKETADKKLVDMRYEGSARRSQTYNKTIIDKVWNFFSSVKVGVWLIVLILVAASIGTILPQVFYVPATTEEDIAAYYERIYGTFGTLYYKLGLSDLYSSWWFQGLIGMLGISLIIASLDRVIPLYKSLKKQKTKRHFSFLKRQRIYGIGNIENGEESISKAEEKLKTMRYNVKREGNALLAERGRFSRWGPYINHLGLILFLFGVMLRALPGFYVDETMWLREGETLYIPKTDGYFLESKEFIYETYSKEESEEVFGDAIDRVGTIAKNYQTNVVLHKGPEGAVAGHLEDLTFEKEAAIQVNKPLKFDNFSVFQMDFRLDELASMTFQLQDKETAESFGEFTINLADPKPVYELSDDAKVEILDYYADFTGFEDGVPQSQSPLPNNPAFLVKMYTPEFPKGETSFVMIKETLEPLGENQHKLAFQSVETRDVSGLTVRKDLTLPILMLGGLIFMIGVAQGSYWNHRRIWIQQLEDGQVVVAAHTNKNWLSIKRDMDAVSEVANLPKYEDQQDEDSKAEKEEGV